MIYEIIKCTTIDSTHEEKELYTIVNCDFKAISDIVIPALNKLMYITNKRLSFIQSRKKIYFRIKGINGIDLAQFAIKACNDTAVAIADYNGAINISNKTIRRYNKLRKIDENKGIVKPFNRAEFDNPFVNYCCFIEELCSGTFITIGQE